MVQRTRLELEFLKILHFSKPSRQSVAGLILTSPVNRVLYCERVELCVQARAPVFLVTHEANPAYLDF